MYLHRHICDVLDEMRKVNKTRNYGGLYGLIEEAQSMANRMESKLYEVKDIRDVEAKWRECKDRDRAMQLLAEEKGKKKKED